MLVTVQGNSHSHSPGGKGRGYNVIFPEGSPVTGTKSQKLTLALKTLKFYLFKLAPRK